MPNPTIRLSLSLWLWGVLIQFSAFAQHTASPNQPWSMESETAIPEQVAAQRSIIPQSYQTIRLDWPQLHAILDEAPMRFSATAAENIQPLVLPLPNGESVTFQIEEAPIMHPGLAAKFPMIRSFAGKSMDQTGLALRFNITPNGFYAQILNTTAGSIYIDPYASGQKEYGIVYYKKDYQRQENTPFVCEVEGKPITKGEVLPKSLTTTNDPVQAPTEAAGDCQLRVYRLALACVAEYTQFHGNTLVGAMSAMATTMTRINGIYETDFGVSMELVENNDQLIFFDPATDPYSNTSGDLGNNQNTCDNIIGSANYDIGHLLTTSGGGVATLNAPCNNGSKARGLSGQGAPVGDPFDVDYVAHEMGHQFGANHTQNNSCNRNGSTAMEPGSASTIMGYAGICSPNVQSNSDDHFHAISIAEIAENITTGSGGTCPTTTAVNNQPVIDAGPDYTLPISTPFTLTAAATDLDDDALTYCWEQMDNEVAPMPPVSTATVGPAFRSNSPITDPARTFPNWPDLINNIDPEWEELPSVSRQMSFRCTVRDNFLGAGCTAEDDVALTFTADAGPFLVLSPNTAISWTVGDFATISWDVANTDQAPVSCSTVNIFLSTDGGLSYPISLAEGVANSGSFQVEVPNQLGDANRVLITCADNIFFDISNVDFSIVAPATPGIAMNVNPSSQAICPTAETLSFNVQLNGLGSFSEMVNLSVEGLPNTADLSFVPASQVALPTVVTITLNNPEVLNEGMNPLTISANGGGISNSSSINIDLLPASPAISTLQSPMHQAI
ncbi:MAG: reprolysin-like metallopeptidase, partial [Bacteroidota bacterium]